MMFKRKIINKNNNLLPKTRKEQFIDIIKNDVSLLVDLSLLDLLFSIPLYLLFFFEVSFINTLSQLTFEKVFPIVFYMGLFSIILFAFKGLSKGASYAIFQKRIFNEGCVFIPTFFKYIRNNFKYYFFSYFILGISYFISSSIIIYFIYLNANSIIKGLGIGIVLLVFLINYNSIQYFLNITNLYDLTFCQCLKNAYSFTLMSFPASIIYFIISLFLPIFLLTLSNYTFIIVSIIYLLFYDGVMLLIASLYSINKFDNYINKENFPTYYKKGLFKEEKPCQN